MANLKRTLGLWECIFFGVGSILGAGIYTLIGKVAGMAGNLTWLAFLIASVIALLTAFSYAELSAAFPDAGGEYTYIKEAFGKKSGITMGIIVAMTSIISGSTVAFGFAGYFKELININLLAASFAVIALMFIVNVIGIKQSSGINIILTIIEISGLFFVIYCAFPTIGNVNYLELPPAGINGLLMAAALAFFANTGFEKIVKLAEETKEPEKNIPRALFVSSIVVIVMYTVVAICAISAVSYEELGQSESPLATIINSKFGKTAAIVIAVIALFSTSNTILSSMIGSSRVLLDMAKETKFLKSFSQVSPKHKTPKKALILIVVLMSAFVFIGNIETIATITTLFVFTTFIIINVAVIKLRVTAKNIARPYRIPGNINNIPVLCILSVVMTLVLLGYNIYSLITRIV
ncbi:MAG: amino acid permease [Bacteroidia bacterium]|jgi:APA family basic amino acid/polyamine antiporter